MTDRIKKQLGATLWKIADGLRGAMNADDFRDYGIPVNSRAVIAGLKGDVLP